MFVQVELGATNNYLGKSISHPALVTTVINRVDFRPQENQNRNYISLGKCNHRPDDKLVKIIRERQKIIFILCTFLKDSLIVVVFEKRKKPPLNIKKDFFY